MRLIDANEIPWCHYDLDNYHSFVGVDKEYVDEMQTIEAEPVRHGRWKNWHPKYLGMEYSYDTKECSECAYVMANALRIPAHYCPNCGAKMDGE